MHRNRNAVLAAVLSLAVASCADAQRTALPPTVSDSAGIRIIDNPAPTGAAASVAARPIVDVGGGTDPSGELAGVVAAVRLGDGRIAIAEQSTRSIRIFDANGRFVRAIGRQGQGPGEFSSITRLDLLADDSLAAYDGLRTTLTVFDTSGRLARVERITAVPGGLSLKGLLADGTMILSRAYNTVFSRTSRLERDPIAYVAIRPPSTLVDTIVQVPGSDVYLFAGGEFASRQELPFGRVSVIAVGRDRIHIGTGDTWQIESRAPDGRLLELRRVRHTPIAVSAADINRFRREHLERIAGTRVMATGGGGGGPDMRSVMLARTKQMLDVMPFPERRAPYDSIISGPDDEVWVRRTHPFRAEPSTWTMVARDGSASGSVTLPGGMRLLHVGRDFIVGMTRDADDVEHVVVHALTRSGPVRGGAG